MVALLVLRVLDQSRAQGFVIEDVDAHRGEVGLRDLRLFLEGGDDPILIGLEDPEAGSLLNRDLIDRDGAFGVGLPVTGEHPVVGRGVNMVAREDQDVFGAEVIEPIEVLVDGVGGPPIPVRPFFGLLRGQDGGQAVDSVKPPVLAVADVGIEVARLVLGQDGDVVDAGIGAVG